MMIYYDTGIIFVFFCIWLFPINGVSVLVQAFFFDNIVDVQQC